MVYSIDLLKKTKKTYTAVIKLIPNIIEVDGVDDYGDCVLESDGKYYIYGLVLEDDQRPELVGTVILTELSVKLRDRLFEIAIDYPAAFHMEHGINLVIKTIVSKRGNCRDYSFFSDDVKIALYDYIENNIERYLPLLNDDWAQLAKYLFGLEEIPQESKQEYLNYLKVENTDEDQLRSYIIQETMIGLLKNRPSLDEALEIKLEGTPMQQVDLLLDKLNELGYLSEREYSILDKLGGEL